MSSAAIQLCVECAVSGKVANLQGVIVRQADDRAIKAEGLENLTEGELREACRARGIRGNVFGEGAPAFMRKKLADWLELSLNRCGDHAGRCR
jgi:LETM1-like protein